MGERSELRGQVLDGKYLVGPCIGLGGTGVVFDARRLSDGERLVVKTLRPCYLEHPDLARRLRREAEVARAVHHNGIIPVLDEGVLDDGSPYVMMKRIRGESLSAILLRDGTLPSAEVALIAIRTLSILHSLHRAGYTHRDVKPEHIILDRTPSDELQVHLLDLGVCASPTAPADERRRENGRVFGTPSYCSPEQASGNPDVDGRADIYGLGVVMFEALIGHVPFRAATVSQLLLRIIREDVPSLRSLAPQLSPDFSELVERSLARNPEDRHASARAFARQLMPFAGDRREIEARVIAARLRQRTMLAVSSDEVSTLAA